MTATSTLPRALKGTVLGIAGAAFAPATVVYLMGFSAILSKGAFTIDELVSTATSGLFFFVAVAFVAGLHSIILGLPAFLVLRAFNMVNWLTAFGGGFLIGALPIAMLTLPSSPEALPWQWSSYVQSVLHFGGYGLSGGAAFWFLWRHFDAQPSSSG